MLIYVLTDESYKDFEVMLQVNIIYFSAIWETNVTSPPADQKRSRNNSLK